MAQLERASYATWEVQCRLCLKKLEDIGDYVEITQKISKTVLEIFPPDLVRFQSDSVVICEQCLEIVETYASFRSEIVGKHQKQEQQLLAVVKIECEPMHLKAVVIKTELEEEFEELSTDFVSFVEVGKEETTATIEPDADASQTIDKPSLKPKQKPKPFECDRCGKKFAAKFFLAEHVLAHIPMQHHKKLFRCSICRKEFTSYGFLRQHGRVNHPCKVFQAMQFQCPYCPRRFTRNDLLQGHIERAHRVDRRTCHICQQVVSSTGYLKKHIKSVHLKEVVDAKRSELVTCEISKRGSIMEHRAAHYKDTWRFSCDLCGKKCRQRIHIIEHVQTHIPVEFRAKKHQCSICKKRFHRQDRLFQHLRMGPKHKKQPESAESHECHCGKSCKTREFLKMHMERVHNREKYQKSCEVCGKVLGNKYQLNNHMKTFHSDGTKDFVCSVCGMKFPLNRRLRTHMGNVHEEKRFVCDFDGCGKKFARRPRMLIHKKTTHLKQKDFKCTYKGCGKEYQKKQGLMGHIKLTHEKRRQNCPISDCSFLAGRPDNMRSHLKKHTELTAAEMSDAVESVKQMELVYC